ncbi:hypothetical protein D477_015067 [Arthrobacter crystallopoietes BAB-32]|uniref:DUF4383 domain-containing protein n=1 Tax=Arthrobacter crystallopoietes BAB-32 TaxID=1246476 RepID=N1V599_9MICC|nr:DUF4383 domain-containing protein [Arthrobacter crystallopoietes]EMY33428.1 hypothetical protein D477_015067 [Arthrobacter crystallopoietes BAB-32]
MNRTTADRTDGTRHRTPVQTMSRVAAVVLLIIGVLGFIPGITANYGQLALMGDRSEAMLLGVLPVSILHNVLLLVFAAVLWWAARSVAAAKTTLLVLAVVNWLMALYGLLNERGTSPYWEPAGVGDNWFHLVLGLVLFAFGLVRGTKTVGRPRRAIHPGTA